MFGPVCYARRCGTWRTASPPGGDSRGRQGSRHSYLRRPLDTLWRVSSDDIDATLNVEGGSAPLPEDGHTAAEDSHPEHELQRGQQVGRFFIVERLGVGGMGVVYRAYDPELHRQLAIKLLHPSLQHEVEDRSRLLREAQAMARVPHPNVISIHDVGTLGDKIYIAMELVEGQTLSGWLSPTKRSWTEVIEAFVQAGRGLAAAHAEDLVHRDFKPDNVMIDEKGRVRVMDFGIARSSGVQIKTGELSVRVGAATSYESTLDTPLTRQGALMGTPAYMAPEQFDGRPTDARTDQFSFCVAVWEGLFGQRPFAGRGFTELMEAVAQGEIADPPPSDVPRAVEGLLRRGLSPAPEDRWPTLSELVDALEEAIAPKRATPWGLWAAIGATAAAAVALTMTSAVEEKCTGAHAAMLDTWNEPRAERIGEAFEALDGRAGQRWRSQRDRLESYATSWEAVHTEVCESTAVRGEQSANVLDLRMACLRRARHDLDETLTVLATPDLKLTRRLYRLVDGLPQLAHCGDIESLQELAIPPSPSVAEAVEGVQRAVARGLVLRRAGRFSDALDVGEDALVRAEKLDFGPLLTDATLAVAEAHAELRNFDKAVPLLLQAQRSAVTTGQWRQAVLATARYVYIVGHFQARPAQALVMGRLGQGFAERAQDARAEVSLRGAITAALGTDGQFDAAIESIEATLAMYDADPSLDQVGRSRELEHLSELLGNQGKFDAAVAAQLEAIEIFTTGRGEDHPEVARKLANLGATYSTMGHRGLAESAYYKALELQERLLPKGHIDAVINRANIAALLASQGRLEEAEPMYQQALDGLEAKFGAKHPNVITTRYNLSGVLRDLGRLEEAESAARRAVADAGDPTAKADMRIAGATKALASILLDKGEFSEAEVAYRTAVRLSTELQGGAHPHTLSARLGLADTMLRSNRAAEAEAMLRAALAEGVAAHGDEMLTVAQVRRDLAALLITNGDTDEPRALLERALPMLEQERDVSLARALFSLAKVLGDSPKDQTRAVELATRAHTLLTADPRETQAADEVAAWLDDRAP